ncbi:MAG: DUF503 domain-containing protein [Phycisphaerae bacterium]
MDRTGAESIDWNMVIGVLQLSLTIPGAMSLKDKRRAIKGLKDRLAARHNISIAEVDDLDEHRKSLVAIALVSNSRRFVESCLSKIVDQVRGSRSVNLVDYDIELF